MWPPIDFFRERIKQALTIGNRSGLRWRGKVTVELAGVIGRHAGWNCLKLKWREATQQFIGVSFRFMWVFWSVSRLVKSSFLNHIFIPRENNYIAHHKIPISNADQLGLDRTNDDHVPLCYTARKSQFISMSLVAQTFTAAGNFVSKTNMKKELTILDL